MLKNKVLRIEWEFVCLQNMKGHLELTSIGFGRCHETEAGVSVGSQDLGRWLRPRGACAPAAPAARQQQIANPCCQPCRHMT